MVSLFSIGLPVPGFEKANQKRRSVESFEYLAPPLPWNGKKRVAPGRLLIPREQLRRPTVGELFRFLKIHRKQQEVERDLNGRGLDFRSDDPRVVERAYSAMTAEEFHLANSRQQHANWILIGHALNRLVPNRPLKVIDIGVGTGTSTQVLAHFLPVGSHITGYDISAALILIAGQQKYRHFRGAVVETDFVAQSVADTFRQTDGCPVPDASVDYINSSGIVGHHLDKAQMKRFVAECRRVLHPHGLVALDMGPAFSQSEMVAVLDQFGLTLVKRVQIVRGARIGQLIFRNKPPDFRRPVEMH